jgi:cytochrome c oxidase subunit 1
MNNTLAYIHFWGTIVCAYLIFWPMHYEGLAGMPRRYYDFSQWQSFKQFGDLNQFITIISIISFALQLLFVFNFFYSIWNGRRLTTQNPWNSNTLEWTTPIKTGHGNWPGEIPEVHRWAYDYGKDGVDHIPQTEPVGSSESQH